MLRVTQPRPAARRASPRGVSDTPSARGLLCDESIMRSIRMLVAAVGFTMACGGGGSAPTDAARPDAGQLPDGGDVPDGGETATVTGHAGNVAGGVTARSPNYKLIGTMGKGDGTASSPSFKHRGGVVGGTQP